MKTNDIDARCLLPFARTMERVRRKHRSLVLSLLAAGLFLWGMDVVARANYIDFVRAYSPGVFSPQKYWQGWKMYMYPCFSDYGCGVGHGIVLDRQETIRPNYIDKVETYGVLWFRFEKRERWFTQH